MSAGIIREIIRDSLIDSANLFPFLLLTYLALEYLERRAGSRPLNLIGNAGKWGPFIGGLSGIVPQCGFAAAAANFFAARAISTGTLLAVFLTTSDEMLPILISNAVPAAVIAKILAIKLFIGVGAGLAVDTFLRKKTETVDVESLCEREDCHCSGGGILKPALYHAVKITLFVLIITLGLNAAVAFAGKDFLSRAEFVRPLAAPFVAALVGLIPNCSASVAVTQLWADGIIGFGSLMSGVLAGGGVGLLVLFRVNRNRRQNILIAAALYVIAVLSGILIEILQINL